MDGDEVRQDVEEEEEEEEKENEHSVASSRKEAAAAQRSTQKSTRLFFTVSRVCVCFHRDYNRSNKKQQKREEGGQGSCRDPSPMPAYPRSHQWLPASSTFHARLSSMASRVASSNWDYRGAAPRSDTSLQMRAGTLQERGWLLTHWERPSTPSTRCRCATWLTAW